MVMVSFPSLSRPWFLFFFNQKQLIHGEADKLLVIYLEIFGLWVNDDGDGAVIGEVNCHISAKFSGCDG